LPRSFNSASFFPQTGATFRQGCRAETSLHAGTGRTTGEIHALARNVQESVHKTHGASLSRDLRIAVIDKNPLRAAIIEEGLRAAGHMSVVRIDDTAELLDRIRAIDPDVILIDLESPSRDVLEQMFKVLPCAAPICACHGPRDRRRPVAMFVDRSDAATIDAAIDAGVSAYIVDGLRKDRVKPILDMTISRFNAFAKLKKELETAKSQLDDRKAIDRAKALVMRAKAIPEEQAYALMRHVAMNENKKIAEIARSIITAAELLR
jgi:two-component system, response regulator / RNA-binding antiterminator